MMDSDLLRREKEYHDLNKELELKTKELLQEVHHVMNQNKNDFTIHFDPGKYEIENDLCQRKSKSAITKKSDAFRVDEKDCKELNIPIDINNMGAKGLVHFLKAKAKQLQMDYDKLLIDYKQKCEEIKKLQRENGKHIEQKEKWLQSSSASKNTSAKLEQQKNILQCKLNARENETVSLKKEIDQLHKELKSLKSNTNSLDVRMTRIVEENDKLKNDLKT
ncbi:PREDICTED: CAP-Gly domain-containing linker protein 1-like isoform X2 [Nicrophorus vespilloides]|nr:PREDICTED: CAP-Gly domain-containing linker protein 1-like isoform X2 [Nicrophorus vespilloides]